MKMSAEGKAFLVERAAGTTLRFFGVAGCCGMNVSAELADAHDDDLLETVEGLTIAIDRQIAPQLANVTIHAEDEQLVLLGYEQTSC